MKRQRCIPAEAFAKRASRAQALLAQTDLDILLINANETHCANVRYFSDYWPVAEAAGIAISPEGEPTLLIAPESEPFAQEQSQIKRIRKLAAYRQATSHAYPHTELADFRQVFDELGVHAPKKIGIAGYAVTTLPIADALKAAFPKAALIPADHITDSLRAIKSASEIACLKEAFRICELAINDIIAEIHPGLTELQVVGIAQEVIYTNGAEYEGMPQQVISGARTAHAVARPSHKVIERGELVQLNISARVNGYCSRVGRPIYMGRIKPHIRERVEFGKAAHEQTLTWLRVGARASDIAARYEAYLSECGYRDSLLYAPCHSVGLTEVEAPVIAPDSDEILAENMVLQVDTFIRDADFGLCWENGVVLTADGIEALSDKHMSVIEIY